MSAREAVADAEESPVEPRAVAAEVRPRPRRSMTDWVRAVAGTNAIVLVLNVLTGVISARVMGPAGKGIFNAVSVWTGAFTGLAGMGLGAAFISSYAKADEDTRPGIARAAFGLVCFWGLLASAVVYFVEPRLIGQNMGPTAAEWARLSSPLVAFTLITGFGGSMLAVSERFGRLNWVQFVRSLLYSLCIASLALLARLTPYTQLLASWALVFLSGAFIFILGCRWLPLRLGWVRIRHLWDLTVLGFRYYSLGLLAMFNSTLDQMIASIWLSKTDMGLYAVAISSLSVTGVVQGAIGRVMFPMMAADTHSAIVERTARVLRRMTPLFGLILLLVWTAAWPMLILIYGPAYSGAVRVVFLIAPTAAFIGAITIFYQGCYALRWFAGPTIGEGVGAGSGALLLALLVPRWGLIGAAVAATLSYALDLGALTVYWCRTSHTPVRDLLPTVRDVRLLSHELRRLPRLVRMAQGPAA